MHPPHTHTHTAVIMQTWHHIFLCWVSALSVGRTCVWVAGVCQRDYYTARASTKLEKAAEQTVHVCVCLCPRLSLRTRGDLKASCHISSSFAWLCFSLPPSPLSVYPLLIRSVFLFGCHALWALFNSPPLPPVLPREQILVRGGWQGVRRGGGQGQRHFINQSTSFENLPN